METLLIPTNRKYIPPAFFVFIFGILLEIFLMYRHGINAGDIAFLILFGVGFGFSLFQLLDRRPAISITADGIHFKRWKKEWTMWEDVREIKLGWAMGRVRVLRLLLPYRERVIAVRYVDMKEEELLRMVIAFAGMDKDMRTTFIRDLNKNKLVISLN